MSESESQSPADDPQAEAEDGPPDAPPAAGSAPDAESDTAPASDAEPSPTPAQAPAADPTAAKLSRCLEDWIRDQPLQDLLPREGLSTWLTEVRGDDAYWEGLHPRFEQAWKKAEDRLRADDRPARELLSPQAVERLLDALEALDPDPEAVRTFLRSPAIEATLGSVLYAGILEFIRKVDLIGNMVNRLPVIGGIRRKVLSAFREEIDTRLESQIKGFLGGFSGKAVERMIQHVLSEQNRAGFRAARRSLGEYLLQRPVSSLVPSPETAARHREAVWKGLRKPQIRDEDKHLDAAYEDHGQDRVGDWTWRLSEAALPLLARPLRRFLDSPAGAVWREELSRDPA